MQNQDYFLGRRLRRLSGTTPNFLIFTSTLYTLKIDLF